MLHERMGMNDDRSVDGRTTPERGRRRPLSSGAHRAMIEPTPGDVLGGHYEIRAHLGAGGMGSVVLAHDRELDRPVAIKLIHPERAHREGTVEALREEARMMARVRHENVAGVYAFGEHEGMPYFVMEYVPGTDLRRELKRRLVPMQLEEALGVLDAICRGLSAIHSFGIVHGDLKPANVLLGSSSRVALSDFGAASLAARDAGALGERNTPAYLAPEVGGAQDVYGPPIPVRVDVYALGVTAFEMLTGRLPFPDARTFAEAIYAHAELEPPAPSLVADVPAAFDPVILRALAKDPVERTATPADFRRELRAATEYLGRSPSNHLFLIVDDDPVFQTLASTLLTSRFPGTRARVAKDGEAALEAIAIERPSLVLLDLEMPRMSGLEVVTRLAEDPSTHDLPIVVITGAGGADDWRALSQLGVSGFLVKPVDLDALTALTNRLLPRPRLSTRPPPPR